MTREFTATIRGTWVTKASSKPTPTDCATSWSASENYDYGFFGEDGVTITGAPDFDGYNGKVGTVGSNNNLQLGSATVDRIQLWDWTNDTGRCTPASVCREDAYDRIEQAAYFRGETALEAACSSGPPPQPWSSATGIPLHAGRCYKSITFNSNWEGTPLGPDGPVYARDGVTIMPNATVNTGFDKANADSTDLRIATGGPFIQNKNSQIAMDVLAPNSTCTVAADTNYLYKTLWLGAATCKKFNVSGNARFRYDGGVDFLAGTEDSGNNHTIWGLYNYQSIN